MRRIYTMPPGRNNARFAAPKQERPVRGLCLIAKPLVDSAELRSIRWAGVRRSKRTTTALTVSGCSVQFLQISERAFLMPVEHQS